MERTLVLLKPECVDRGLINSVMTMLEEFSIVGLKLIPRVSEEKAKEHYNEHKDKDFYPYLCEQFTGNPVVAIVYEGEDCISLIMEICKEIRDKFSDDTLEKSREEKRAFLNVIHRSDSSKSAMKEIPIWFDLTKELI